MSGNSGPLASNKGDSTSSKASKPAYDHLDINKLYKGKSTEPVTKTVTQKHGMQALGKAIPARRPGQTSVKAESTPNDVGISSASSGSQNSSSAASAPPNQGQQSQGNHPPAGWASTLPHPPGPPSPHSVPNVPVTGQHIQDKNWSGGRERGGQYPSQRFAQDFPSLASGGDGQKGTATTNAGGPPQGVQGPQSLSKNLDNQYGPGPILRPQTEGSWTQGGGRGMPRPPGPAPPLNAPSREFPGPDRANLGGPTPPPMSLGQGGPAPPPLGAYPMPYRGMMPPPPYMYANGPPPGGPGGPGPGVFYAGGGMFGMPIPPRAPPPPSSGNHPSDGQMHRGGRGPPPPQQQRPGSHFVSNPIIKDEDLKRMDEIGMQDGGWSTHQDEVDYNKVINFSDEDDGREGGKKLISRNNTERNRGEMDRKEEDRDRDRDRDRERERDDGRIERMAEPRRPTKIMERQPSINERERERDPNPRDRIDREKEREINRDRDQRFENIPPKDIGRSREGPYNYNDGEEDWKSQQQQSLPPSHPQQQQQQQQRRPYDDQKNRDPRDRRMDDRNDPRRRPNDRRADDTGDNWRSAPPRQFEEDNRGNKGPPPRGREREEPRNDPRDFTSKNHPSNLPPRLQRQQLQAAGPSPGIGSGGSGVVSQPLPTQQQLNANQRQTPSPGSSSGKDREFQSNRDWEPREKPQQPDRRRMEADSNRNKRDMGRDRRYYNDYEPRSDRHSDKDQNKSTRFASDFQRERSKESDDTKSGSSSVGGGSGGVAPSRSTIESSRPSPPVGQGADTESSKKIDESEVNISSKPKMSWADEMDDDENLRVREQEDVYVSRKSAKPSMNQNQEFGQRSVQNSASKPVQTQSQAPPDYYPKQEERQKRVYIHKHQRKVADMQSQKPDPPVELKQSSEPTKQDPEQTEKTAKPVSAWGERESRDKLVKQEQKESSPQSQKDGNKSGEKDGRRSIEKEIIHRNSVGSVSSPSNTSPSSAQQSGSNVNCSSEQDASNSGNKSAVISKSSSGRSIGGDAPEGNVTGSDLRSNSISDASDRDHVDRDSVSSQDTRSKRNYSQSSRQQSQDKSFSNSTGGSGESKYKPRPSEREKREKTLSERGEGSDGDQHGGSRGDKSQRGQQQQRNRDRGSYPVYHPRGERQWDRPAGGPRRGARGSGRGVGRPHEYDKPSKRSDSEREYHENDDILEETRQDVQSSEPKEEKTPDRCIENPPTNLNNRKEGSCNSVDDSGQQRAKKDKDSDSQSGKKTGRNSSGGKRNNARGPNKLEGYGPPSDQKPFSNASPGSKEDDPSHIKEKGSEAGQPPSKDGSGGIPSLMAFDISPPSMSQLKKGNRDRDFPSHGGGGVGGGRSSVPPRMQGQRGPGGGGAEYYSEKERFRGNSKRGKGDNPSSGVSLKKNEGEESEEWTDNENDSDDESKKSGTTSSKTRKESGGYQEVKKKNFSNKQQQQQQQPPEKQQQQLQPQQQQGFGGNGKASGPVGPRVGDKGGKGQRIKNPPYEPRSSAHPNLPPRLAAKQRDSQQGNGNGNGGPPVASVGNGKSAESNHSSKGVEPAAPPPTNAWEKPISSSFRSDQSSQQNQMSSAGSPQDNVDQNELKLPLNVASIPGNNTSSSSSSNNNVKATVLDGTNPPARTMIFENRNLKSGFGPDSKTNAASKLPEAKKDTIPTSGIEFGKNLGPLGFGKGPGEDSPELDFGSSPFDDPAVAVASVSQNQAPPTSMMSTHVSSPKPASLLQQSSRHSYDHQPSPISPCAAELTEKIQSVKRVWETPPMPSVPEQQPAGGSCGQDENSYHGPFGSDSFKGSEGNNRDFGPTSLSQSSVGYSGGSSPSLSVIAKPESSSSPSSNNVRQTFPSKQNQQQPPVSKAQGHGVMQSPFGNYGMDPQQQQQQQHLGANNFGGMPVVAQQPKVMFASKVVPLDPFGSQYSQYPNAPSAQCGPYGQGGSVLIRPLEPKFQPMSYQQQHATQNRTSGQGTNHNRVSPGPITSGGTGGGNAGGGAHMNSRSNTMMQKNSQPNRNTTHTCMTQSVHPAAQQNFYHTHHNPIPQQQVHKGSFGPANGGYSDGGITSAYQPQILIPVDVNTAMFNLSGSYESSELSRGPPPQGAAPPGTPPVQGSSSYYFGSNNNPGCVFPSNTSQNYGLPFTASLKMPGFNSSGSAASDSGSNLASQRIRPGEQHSFIQPGLDSLPQNAMKSGHDFMMNQPRWNSSDYSVNQGIHWSAPGPIQRPIYNTSSTGPVGMAPMVHSSSHFMPTNIGGPPGCVGVKPNNSSNDSMTNPGTPPKSPHPRKNI